MRTLTVLSAVLLLAFLTHTEPLRESTEELPAQEQPEAWDQDMAISFVGDKRVTQEASGIQLRGKYICRKFICSLGEYQLATCVRKGLCFPYCCH